MINIDKCGNVSKEFGIYVKERKFKRLFCF